MLLCLHLLEKRRTRSFGSLLERSSHKKICSFDDFVLRGLEGAIANSAEHFIPQHKFICDDAGKVLVDFVGRVERMQEDYQYLADRLGITAKARIKERH